MELNEKMTIKLFYFVQCIKVKITASKTPMNKLNF